jgi:tRNA U34 5-methylaminomethyl-2-thiouridine-forming methyltransferase MnmC
VNNLQLVVTEDGSHTLYDTQKGQHYHSVHGALAESEHVFIQAGLQHLPMCLKTINLLEVGFGSGLNALLTAIESKKQKRKINYVAIEPFPIDNQLIEHLNFAEITQMPEAIGYFSKIHKANWLYPSFLSDYFILSKIQAPVQDTELGSEKFNLIYFDAFSPDVEPELWTKEIFQKLYNCLSPEGLLVTYSCKGDVKRALKAAGFIIEKLPGPKGKREILRATKTKLTHNHSTQI